MEAQISINPDYANTIETVLSDTARDATEYQGKRRPAERALSSSSARNGGGGGSSSHSSNHSTDGSSFLAKTK